MGQPGANKLGKLTFALHEIGQGDLIEAGADPMFQGVPQGAQGTRAVVDAVAVGRYSGMALAIARIVVQRLAESQEQRPQADVRGRPCQAIPPLYATPHFSPPPLRQYTHPTRPPVR